MLRTNTAKWIESRQRWQINVQKNGTRKTFVSSLPGRSGQREANRKADEWLEGRVSSRSLIVEKAYEEYLEEQKQTTSLSNYRIKLSRWSTWIEPEIGKKKLASITEQDLQQIINNAFAQGRSRKTLKNLQGDITSFFKFCRKAQYTAFMPEFIHIPDGARYKGKTILQPEDIAVLMNTDTTERLGKVIEDPYVHYYRLAVLTGLRPGELLGLRWSDIKDGYIQVRGSINAYGERTAGKNANALRAVPLSDLAREEIEAQRKMTGRFEELFPGGIAHSILKRWHSYCKANNLPITSLYELRHTFVSIAQNLPEGQLKKLVGHSRNMDTYGVYAHAVTGENDIIKDNLDSIFDVYK